MTERSVLVRRIASVGASLALAVCAPSTGFAQDHEYGLGVPYVDRPLAVPARHVHIQTGFGFDDDTARGNAGLGYNLDATVGLVRTLDIGAGFGIRFGAGAQAAGAERPVRVNTEWLPADVPTQHALGADPFTNPYIHMRWGIVDHGPIQVGLEGFTQFPFAGGTCWTPGVGIPIHVVAGHFIRIETGFFNEFLAGAACPNLDTMLYIPARLNFQLTQRIWLGVRGDIEARDYRFDRDNYDVQLGFQGGIRIVRQLDLQFQFVFPEFLHHDAGVGDIFVKNFGVGVAFLIRLP